MQARKLKNERKRKMAQEKRYTLKGKTITIILSFSYLLVATCDFCNYTYAKQSGNRLKYEQTFCV